MAVKEFFSVSGVICEIALMPFQNLPCQVIIQVWIHLSLRWSITERRSKMKLYCKLPPQKKLFFVSGNLGNQNTLLLSLTMECKLFTCMPYKDS